VLDASANILGDAGRGGTARVLAFFGVPKGWQSDSLPTCVARGQRTTEPWGNEPIWAYNSATGGQMLGASKTRRRPAGWENERHERMS
jgi:hypothetical protein